MILRLMHVRAKHFRTVDNTSSGFIDLMEFINVDRFWRKLADLKLLIFIIGRKTSTPILYAFTRWIKFMYKPRYMVGAHSADRADFMQHMQQKEPLVACLSINSDGWCLYTTERDTKCCNSNSVVQRIDIVAAWMRALEGIVKCEGLKWRRGGLARSYVSQWCVHAKLDDLKSFFFPFEFEWSTVVKWCVWTKKKYASVDRIKRDTDWNCLEQHPSCPN
jgi:hypothetical protein